MPAEPSNPGPHATPAMLDVVCGIITNDDGRFLACLRPQGKHLGGMWEFPGGKVDAGESPRAALKRELHEELTIDVEVGDPLTQVIFPYDDRIVRLLPFRCKIVAGIPQALEHEEILWCLPQDFHQLPWAPADLPILREIHPPPPKP